MKENIETINRLEEMRNDISKIAIISNDPEVDLCNHITDLINELISRKEGWLQ